MFPHLKLYLLRYEWPHVLTVITTLIHRAEQRVTVTVRAKPAAEGEDAGKLSPVAIEDGVSTNSLTSRNYSRSLSHISESSADGIVLTDRSAGESGEAMSVASGLSVNDIEMEVNSRTQEQLSSPVTDTDTERERLVTVQESTSADNVADQHQEDVPTPSSPSTGAVDTTTPSQTNSDSHTELNTLPDSMDVTYVARRVAVEEEVPGAGEGDGPVDCGLEEALSAVVSSMDDYRGQFPELQILEQELKLLQVTLKVSEHV